MNAFGFFRRLALCLAFLAFSFSHLSRDAHAGTSKSGDAPAQSDLFVSSNIVRISITIPEAGLNELRRYSWGGGGDAARPSAKATISDGTKTYTDVMVHLKGAAGSFRQVDDHPAFTLNFDKYVPDQSFHGLKKLSLNNSVQDPSYITEKLCRELFEAAGVPVPRSDFAVVTLNGRSLGLYVLVEGYSKQFLRRYFKDVSGNLYDGGFCRDITEKLGVNSGDKPNDQSDLRRLVEAANSARSQNKLSDLAQVLDIDRFVSFAAIDVLQVNWDGYCMNRNNYRVFHDKASNKMIFMPHGLDQMFGTSPQGSPHTPMIPGMNGLVADAVVGTTEGRARYIKRFAELHTNVFKLNAMTARVREIQARIEPVLQQVRPGSVERHKAAVNYLCEKIRERCEFVDGLFTAQTQLAFDANGAAPLKGWRPRSTIGTGHFDHSSPTEGRKALHIAAGPQSNASSWRTRVFLEPGRYRFEGMARSKGTAHNGDSGLALRISGSPTRPSLRGDNDWAKLSFPFEVPPPGIEVELVCELKGTRGEAWFDADSLQLRKVQ